MSGISVQIHLDECGGARAEANTDDTGRYHWVAVRFGPDCIDGVSFFVPSQEGARAIADAFNQAIARPKGEADEPAVGPLLDAVPDTPDDVMPF